MAPHCLITILIKPTNKVQYENRQPQEGINTPSRHPLAEFLRLGIAALVALLLFGLLLNAAGGHLGGLLPYRAELWLADKVDQTFQNADQESPFEGSPVHPALNDYLQQLGARVEAALELEPPMSIRLHYKDEDIVNAFATIGGHVFLYKGLLRQLPSENALTMLIAHEYSHVQLRHTARGVGGGIAVAVGASVLPGGGGVEGRLYSLTQSLSSMNFSRDMETEADTNGLRAVYKIYGHVAGADDLFELFMQQKNQSGGGLLEGFFSTHPLDDKRIQSIGNKAEQMGWPVEGEITLLPPQFRRWLNIAE